MKVVTFSPVILLALLFLPAIAVSKELCNINLDNWLKCNDPIVKNYVMNLRDGDIGKYLSGIQLTDNTKELKGRIFLGKVKNLPP